MLLISESHELEEDAHGDLLYTVTRAWSDGTRGIKLSPLEWVEKLTALVPPPRVHQVRYGGWLAAHSQLRRAITPTRRQQGIEEATRPASSRWGWARLLKRVCALDLERCPQCHQGTVRVISSWQLPPPMAPAHVSQERCAWASGPLLERGMRARSKTGVRRHGRRPCSPRAPSASQRRAGAGQAIVGVDPRGLTGLMPIEDTRGRAETWALKYLSVNVL